MSDTTPTEDDTDVPILNFNPQEGELEMVDEINNEISSNANNSSTGGGSVVEIIAHRWEAGRLQLQVSWNTEEMTWEDFRDLKLDKPRLTAQYIFDNEHTIQKSSSRSPDRNHQWARKTLRDLERANRRLRRLYDFYHDDCDHINYVRRMNEKRKNKKIHWFFTNKI